MQEDLQNAHQALEAQRAAGNSAASREHQEALERLALSRAALQQAQSTAAALMERIGDMRDAARAVIFSVERARAAAALPQPVAALAGWYPTLSSAVPFLGSALGDGGASAARIKELQDYADALKASVTQLLPRVHDLVALQPEDDQASSQTLVQQAQSEARSRASAGQLY